MKRNFEADDDAARAISSFYEIVAACESRGVKVAVNGARFICHVPSMGPLGYLHTLYPACADDMLEEISEIFGFPLPQSYASFLRQHNGASLFCNSIAIFGLVRNFSRSLKDEDQTAISIGDKCEISRAAYRNDWNDGWRPIGSAVASNLHKLMINSDGVVKIRCASGNERSYGSFLELLNVLLLAWSKHFTCDGFTGHDDYAGLEKTAERLASPVN